jgi:hypothetical protein
VAHLVVDADAGGKRDSLLDLVAVLVFFVVKLGGFLLDGLVAEVADVDHLGAGLARGEGGRRGPLLSIGEGVWDGKVSAMKRRTDAAE